MKTIVHQVETTWGVIETILSGNKVLRCTLPFLEETPAAPCKVMSRRRDAVTRFISGALNGKTMEVPRLACPPGTDFQQRVWQAIARIPAGRTITYSELAKAAGRPRAIRAAAGACGRNPLPLFIPCHRVTAKQGGLGGFSAGVPWKKYLLTAEANTK